MVPQPAPRPRVSKFGAYMPASYKAYQKQIVAGLPKLTAPPLAGELFVEIECVCKPIGKSKFTTPMGDVDNLAKGVLDTLTDEGWWQDDRQIVRMHISKRFPLQGEEPHINFQITELP